jgi:hypothetical protein
MNSIVPQKAGKIPKYDFSFHNISKDGLHYLIGMIIVTFLVYAFIQTHKYFSKDNIPIIVPKAQPLPLLVNQQQQQLSKPR